MKKILFICSFIMLFSTLCFAQNPFVTSIYTADPSAHVWADGRLYVYPSHDIDPNQGCDLMDKYHVYSTADMVNWVDEGEILRASQVSWGRPEGGFMWAPDCAYKNGTYYFYFPHPSGTDWGSTWKIGVATSTKPASGFTSQGYIAGLESLIDPAVFVDDDGQAYLYYGGGGVCKGGKLNADMKSINGTMQSMTGLQDFHEATWVHKYNGLYYLSYADNYTQSSGGDNRMRYATSTNPLGPWTYRGIIMNPTDSFCAHGSIVQFKGQWYVFYFNSAISNNDWLRSICVDRLYYNADGTIQLVTQTTSGPPAVSPTSPPVPVLAKYEAENAAIGNGATVGNDSAASGGKCIQNLHLANSYVQFNNVNGAGGRTTVHIYYSANGFAKMNLNANGVDYSFVNMPTTGGWSNYSGHAYLTIPLNAGTTNTIKLTGGNGGVNIDYITTTAFNDPVVTPTPGTTPTPTKTPTPTPTRTPTPGQTLFQTGLESGNIQPTWSNTTEAITNVGGYTTGLNPECGVRTGETTHAGTASLMFSGADNSATTSFCYFKVFDVNIAITSTTKLSYWFYPQMELARGVAVDFVCTDGTTLRDCGATDQNGISMHPGHFRGTVNTWNQVQCNIGQWLNGKTIDRILVGYDLAPSTGQFRGYIDDILINN